MAHLFEPLALRGLTLPHRIVVSPMCQYSAVEGVPTDWHLVHLGSRAVGGASLVIAEATGVSAQGRISPGDTGIWNAPQTAAWAKITAFIHEQGSVAGIQLAHAGRKGSTAAPWAGGAPLKADEGAWTVCGPSRIPFKDDYPVPHELTVAEIHEIVNAFARAAKNSLEAGFQVVEIHAAHGYLLHEFLSPLSNTRTDAYGGSFENRARLLFEVVAAVRQVWPEHLPLFVRVSATDWVEGGWSIEDTVELARRLKSAGVDLLDCSSGGNAAQVNMFIAFGYQTGFAERVRRETGLATGAVGMITSPAQADHIVRSGQADLVLIAREFLRDPYFPQRAARDLGQVISYPRQYVRLGPPGTPIREPVSRNQK